MLNILSPNTFEVYRWGDRRKGGIRRKLLVFQSSNEAVVRWSRVMELVHSLYPMAELYHIQHDVNGKIVYISWTWFTPYED
jgi:hypothetical protein